MAWREMEGYGIEMPLDFCVEKRMKRLKSSSKRMLREFDWGELYSDVTQTSMPSNESSRSSPSRSPLVVPALPLVCDVSFSKSFAMIGA